MRSVASPHLSVVSAAFVLYVYVAYSIPPYQDLALRPLHRFPFSLLWEASQGPAFTVSTLRSLALSLWDGTDRTSKNLSGEFRSRAYVLRYTGVSDWFFV